MKNLTDMIKSNPIVVAAIAVAVLAIAALFVVVRPQGASFIAEMQKRKQDTQTVNNLMKTQIETINPIPDREPIIVNATVNDVINKKMIENFQKLGEQMEVVFKNATATNMGSHKPMLEGLFPAPADPGNLFAAKGVFIRELLLMLGKPSIADKNAPRLNAGAPLSHKFIDEEMLKVDRKYRNSFFPPKTEGNLTLAEERELAKLRRAAALPMIIEHARRISIYAYNDPRLSEEFPFHIDDWATNPARPQLSQIWEGQMKLWIQQDLVRAIARANRPSRVEGSLHTEDTVLTAPIKQLIRIRVNEDYVDITGPGAMASFSLNRETTGQPLDYTRGDTMQVITEELKNYDIDKPLPDAFNLSMTGRVSNGLYDVRHVELSVIAEFRQLPALFKAIGQVNYMTVLNTRLTDVDEYDLLQQHHIAVGQNDCVRVDLLIETIWLREWTAQWMPQEVKDRLIVQKPADTGLAPPGAPGPGFPGAPGSNAP